MMCFSSNAGIKPEQMMVTQIMFISQLGNISCCRILMHIFLNFLRYKTSLYPYFISLQKKNYYCCKDLLLKANEAENKNMKIKIFLKLYQFPFYEQSYTSDRLLYIYISSVNMFFFLQKTDMSYSIIKFEEKFGKFLYRYLN